MIAVIQRVIRASVVADGKAAGSIDRGLYILLGVEKGDTEEASRLLCEKISKLRIFSDEKGKMNLSVNDIDGEVLVVSNFTLCANYAHGNRPDYFAAAGPSEANALYECFNGMMREKVKRCVTGVFGADMQTDMITDGPVTIVMHSGVLMNKRKG